MQALKRNVVKEKWRTRNPPIGIGESWTLAHESDVRTDNKRLL